MSNTFKIQCPACGKYFNKVTQEHIKGHGLNWEEYRERLAYVEGMTEEVVAKKRILDGELTTVVVTKEQEDNKLVARAALERMSSEERRDAVAQSVTTFSKNQQRAIVDHVMELQEVRANIFKRYMFLISKLQDKFFSEPWRFEKHEDGTPVTTNELVTLWSIFSRDAASIADYSLRMASIVSREKMVASSKPTSLEGFTFTGSSEVLGIPSNEREKIRILLDRFKGIVSQGGQVSATLEQLEKQTQLPPEEDK